MQTRTKTLIIAAATLALATAIAVSASLASDGWRGGRHYEQQAGFGHHMGGCGGPGKHGHRGGQAMMMLELYDSDGDDSLTQAEIDEGRAKQLASFDANGDKVLSLDEFQALWLEVARGHMVDRFQRLDADGDAGVTLEEFQKPFTRMVERFDRNDDGKVGMDDRPRRGRDYDSEDDD